MDTIDDYLSYGRYRVFGYDKDVKTITVSYINNNHGILYRTLKNKFLGAEIKNNAAFNCKLCEKKYHRMSFCNECYLIIRDSKIRKLAVIPSIIDIMPDDMNLCKSMIYCLEYRVRKVDSSTLRTDSSGLQTDSSGLQTDTYIISQFAYKDNCGVVKHIKGVYSVLESREYISESPHIRDTITVAVISRKVLRRMMIFREYGLINDVFLVILRQWIALEN